jgi:beta-glucosidase-like glycosyl hydrolase
MVTHETLEILDMRNRPILANILLRKKLKFEGFVVGYLT